MSDEFIKKPHPAKQVEAPAPRRVAARPAEMEDEHDRPNTSGLPVTVVAALVFASCGWLAAGAVEPTLRRFAEDGGISSPMLVSVPGLFAMLFAIFAYQNAARRVTTMAQSLSRGLLVALLTWASFSGLATWVWCLPADYGRCYGSFLLVSGLVGGGPMLAAAAVGGTLMGWLIVKLKPSWLKLYD